MSMSLSTVAPKVSSNLRQYGHKESSYSDNTTVGWPVPGSVIRLLDVTRIALVSRAAAVGSGDSIRSAATAIINTTAVTAARVSRRTRLVLATQRSLSPRTEPGAMTQTDVGHAYRERICERNAAQQPRTLGTRRDGQIALNTCPPGTQAGRQELPIRCPLTRVGR